MVIALFGENCTGKSSVAALVAQALDAKVYNGRDYLRLAKSESEAKALFCALLSQAVEGEQTVIYVISEEEQLALLPVGARRVLVTASIDRICERFAKRMRGQLPPPVRARLERDHGKFDAQPHELRLCSDMQSPEEGCAAVLALCR